MSWAAQREMAHIEKILREGTGADRQLAVWERTQTEGRGRSHRGGDLPRFECTCASGGGGVARVLSRFDLHGVGQVASRIDFPASGDSLKFRVEWPTIRQRVAACARRSRL